MRVHGNSEINKILQPHNFNKFQNTANINFIDDYFGLVHCTI